MHILQEALESACKQLLATGYLSGRGANGSYTDKEAIPIIGIASLK